MAKREITILGVNDGHDAGAALVKNGQVVAAVQEERLNNIKHYTGVPEKSIFELFKISRVHPSEVSLISIVSYDPPGKENLGSFKTKTLLMLSPLLHSDTYIRLYSNYKKNHRDIRPLRKTFEDIGLAGKENVLIEHQMAHAAVAYRSSPWGYGIPNNSNIGTPFTSRKDQDVLILTADGAGDGLSSSVNIGHDGFIKRIAHSSYYDSLGNAFYTEVTRALGLRPWDHESKVMGLAPYGKSSYCIDKMRTIICLDRKKPLRFKNTIGGTGPGIQSKLKRLLENQRFDNIAAAAQQHLEDLMTKWAENAIASTGLRRVACAGGIFLNVKMNKLLKDSKEVEDIFIYPAPDDEGSAVGAALQGYYEYCLRDGIQPEHVPISHTYYGPSPVEDEIKQLLVQESAKGKSKWKYSKTGDIEGALAELVVKGKIVARCSGGLEWGPRALGNRSIVADPQDMQVIHKINFAIKQRDFWMPFAPSILEERKDDYLVNAEFAPYMIMAFDSTPSKEGGGRIPATVHPYDKTCRPQTVRKEWNPNYYKIIKLFEKETGVGAVLNTSFNLHGYPMVGTPKTALWTFENSKLDGLVLGDYLITKHA